MNAYLRDIFGVNPLGLRNTLLNSGFNSLEDLVTMTDEDVVRACSIIRKSEANNRHITPVLETKLKKLATAATYKHMVQRDLNDYTDLTMDNLDAIYYWKRQLDSDPDLDSVKKFSSSGNKKCLFEAVESCLQVRKGNAGLTIWCASRTEPVPAIEDDPGFLEPTVQEELRRRGRHDGHFWQGDNRLVFNLVRHITQGTIAWGEVKNFERRGNGQGE